MGKAVEQRSGHLGIPKDTGPFPEAEVGGDDQAGGGYVETPPGLQMQQHIKDEPAKESNAGIAAVKVELTNDPVAQATTVEVTQPAVEPVANAASEKPMKMDVDARGSYRHGGLREARDAHTVIR